MLCIKLFGEGKMKKLLHIESQTELLENSVFQEKIRRQKKKLVSEEGKKYKEERKKEKKKNRRIKLLPESCYKKVE